MKESPWETLASELDDDLENLYDIYALHDNRLESLTDSDNNELYETERGITDILRIIITNRAMQEHGYINRLDRWKKARLDQ